MCAHAYVRPVQRKLVEVGSLSPKAGFWKLHGACPARQCHFYLWRHLSSPLPCIYFTVRSSTVSYKEETSTVPINILVVLL